MYMLLLGGRDFHVHHFKVSVCKFFLGTKSPVQTYNMYLYLNNCHVTDLHLFWCVILWCPVRYSSHPHLTIPKLLTEGSILGL